MSVDNEYLCRNGGNETTLTVLGMKTVSGNPKCNAVEPSLRMISNTLAVIQTTTLLKNVK